MSKIQSAGDLFAAANASFVDEDYEDALQQYTEAIELDEKISDYYVKRSFCHYKLKNFAKAIADANQALTLDKGNSKAYLRKGIALFAEDEYESALAAFNKGSELDAANRQFKKWIRKCKAEIAEDEDDLDLQTPAPTQTTQPEKPVKEEAAAFPDDMPGLEPDPATKATEPADTPMPDAPAKKKRPPLFRHDWFQTTQKITVSVFAKNQKKEDVKVDIQKGELSVCIKLLEGKEFILDLELCDEVVPAESKFVVLSSKIEISLKKATPNQWPTLENTGQSAREWATVSDPKNKPKRKDWDKIAEDLYEEDNTDGDHKLNKRLKVFRDIFAGATDDQRRAMQKSFQESGGTVLSTNWDEISKKKTEVTPPDGLEVKKWSDLTN
mmetsp:Transcript_28451/g.31608  ORF Transcript_28451/g.31608 Transcript_28451/m.31608 type:complete len:383 (+) Transcript_28451:54-1202(+)